MSMGIMNGKVCIVTGGAVSIGFAAADVLIREGARGMLGDNVFDSVSKHALIGLARAVEKETASRRIRVNVLAPGPVDNSFQSDVEAKLTEVAGLDGTEFLNGLIPLGRHGKAEEIAQMVLFLASDQSAFSTGAVFMADGGMHI
jgi:NAD(P)-dependent dehydrogenase (short-subunit alcohol dehydrogenase family)